MSSVFSGIKIHWGSLGGGLASIISVLAANAGQLPPKIATPVAVLGTIIAMLSHKAVQPAQ